MFFTLIIELFNSSDNASSASINIEEVALCVGSESTNGPPNVVVACVFASPTEKIEEALLKSLEGPPRPTGDSGFNSLEAARKDEVSKAVKQEKPKGRFMKESDLKKGVLGTVGTIPSTAVGKLT